MNAPQRGICAVSPDAVQNSACGRIMAKLSDARRMLGEKERQVAVLQGEISALPLQIATYEDVLSDLGGTPVESAPPPDDIIRAIQPVNDSPVVKDVADVSDDDGGPEAGGNFPPPSKGKRPHGGIYAGIAQYVRRV